MKAREVLGDFFVNEYRIGNEEIIPEWIDARELLVGCRLDLAAKIAYVKAYKEETGMEWAEELYKKHILALSGGNERGNNKKNTVYDYIRIFKKLIDDISLNGIDPNKSVIPVGEDSSIMDGAHRVAIAIYLGIKVPIIRLLKVKSNYGYEFFKERMLEDIFLDYMVLEFIKWKKDAYSLCVWPKVGNSQYLPKMEDILRREGDIVYKKRVELSYSGLCNLMIEIYKEFEWIGKLENNYKGTIYKADLCYIPSSPMWYYVVNIDSLEHIQMVKEEIRSLFQVEKSSIHTTDTWKESINIGKMLLSDLSIQFLNVAKPYERSFYFNKIKNVFDACDIDMLEHMALTGDSVLALYGIKESNTVYLVLDNSNVHEIKMPGVEYINSDSLCSKVQDPRCFFYFGNVKCMSLNALVKYSELNKNDEKLANAIVSMETRSNRIEIIIREMQRWQRNKKRLLRDNILDILKHYNLYEPASKMWHKIKR